MNDSRVKSFNGRKNLKTAILNSTLFAMLSCTSNKSVEETGDSHETGAQETYKPSEVLLAHISATLPYFSWREAFLVSNPDKTDPCPHVAPTADDKGLIVTGGCTDSRGIVFSGSFLINSAETGNSLNYEFNAFSTRNNAHFVEMDGQVQINLDTDILTNNLAIQMADESHNITLLATYTDHSLGPLADVGEVFGGRAGKFASQGIVELEKVDRFVLDGRFENADECDKESDNTVLLFTGERGTLTFIESAESCDGCTEWTTGPTSGKICIP
jgi:hypothetical protein